jgi:hypothetical protein
MSVVSPFVFAIAWLAFMQGAKGIFCSSGTALGHLLAAMAGLIHFKRRTRHFMVLEVSEAEVSGTFVVHKVIVGY